MTPFAKLAEQAAIVLITLAGAGLIFRSTRGLAVRALIVAVIVTVAADIMPVVFR